MERERLFEMGWKPVSHKKHHDKHENDKHPPSMMRTLEEGVFIKMRETDKAVIDIVPVVKE